MASRTGNQDTAKRYATAFFELAKEQSQLDVIGRDMQTLDALLDAGGEILSFMHNPTLRREAQAEALSALAAHLKLSPASTQLLGTLALKRRLDILALVIDAVQAMIAAHKGEVTADVTAAQALEQGQIDRIAANLKKAIGADVKVKLHVDPSIMGGLIIRVGSRLIDSSVKTKLERLHRALKSSNNTSDQKKMKEVA
ncbi:MAG: F0F1 ATP synthase subunit delta [Alphaproteobacteria bacterium]|nr:F0F1 ATP synthase subunit delta [Alphaproteobacteria bacterium]